jgi:phosphatidylserine decarboxylase
MTKEGAIFPIPFIILAVIFYLLFLKSMSIALLYIAVGFFFLGLLIILFFRDPERKTPKGEKLIVSPADGKIIRLETECENPSISIFMGLQNVHVNRAPVDGVIKTIVFHQGKFLAAYKPEAMKDNQRNEIEIETDNSLVKMQQVTGAIARRTICYKKAGDKIETGERIGLIRFGSRVDLFLPRGTKLDIRLGQKVLAGETVIGRLT